MINKFLHKKLFAGQAGLPAGRQGFTLIETLVAMLLLSLSIAGPLTIASKGLSATNVAKDQFVAFYLAQDAVEYVRYVRDSNCLQNPSNDGSGCSANKWLAGLQLCTSSGGTSACYVDSIQDSVKTCPSGSCPALNYDSSAGHHYFSYTSGTATPQQFVRTVKIDNTNSDEAVVTVTVTWSDIAGVSKHVIVRENIFRWQ